MEALMTARHLFINGRVQGVGYRDSAVAIAQQLGVNGWVRNCRDGNVEALVSGPEEEVEAFIDWAWQGPSAARVNHIEVEKVDLEVEQQGFVRLPNE
jgi:acylphosphatase